MRSIVRRHLRQHLGCRDNVIGQPVHRRAEQTTCGKRRQVDLNAFG
jgi:hypothetical protein